MIARLLTALILVVLFQDDAADPAPEITTLELDEELVSYGRLGGVAVDAEGNPYVVSFGNDLLVKIDPPGKILVDDI